MLIWLLFHTRHGFSWLPGMVALLAVCFAAIVPLLPLKLGLIAVDDEWRNGNHASASPAPGNFIQRNREPVSSDNAKDKAKDNAEDPTSTC